MPTARQHLEQLAARPRAAGSTAEAAARAYCAHALDALGFTIREEPFSYSALPGRWGTPIVGVLGVTVIAGAGHFGWRGHATIALAVLLVGGAVIIAATRVLLRWGVTRCPWKRATGVNLVASRGRPAVWLVAHLDSKSQPVPIAVRALGVLASIVVWCAAACVALLQAGGARALAGAWPWLALAAVIAGAPVASSVVRDRSPGALDDASGVATVLRAIELAPRDLPLGVLLTSAEELGLAGARAWVRGDVPPGVAINVDGVDDQGALRLTFTRRPSRLLRALCEASDEPVNARALVAGVLVDSVALADGGWETVTVSRGSWRTVARIHTPRDCLASLAGTGVEETARWLVRALGAGTISAGAEPGPAFAADGAGGRKRGGGGAAS